MIVLCGTGYVSFVTELLYTRISYVTKITASVLIFVRLGERQTNNAVWVRTGITIRP
jgi:hypothetical protein